MENPTKQEAIHALTQLGVNSSDAALIIEGLPQSFKTVIAITTRANNDWHIVTSLGTIVNYTLSLKRHG